MGPIVAAFTLLTRRPPASKFREAASLFRQRCVAKLTPPAPVHVPARIVDPATLRVLVDFVQRQAFVGGSEDPDIDVLSAYNVALEATYRAIRRAADA